MRVGLRSYRATSQPLSTLAGALVAPARPISRHNVPALSFLLRVARSLVLGKPFAAFRKKEKVDRSVGRQREVSLAGAGGPGAQRKQPNPPHSTPSLPWKCQKISRVSEARKDGAKVQGGVQGG